MRGRRNPQITMLAFIDLEERVPPAHPLRTIKRLADEALADLSATFNGPLLISAKQPNKGRLPACGSPKGPPLGLPTCLRSSGFRHLPEINKGPLPR